MPSEPNTGVIRDMEIFKPQPRRVDHHNHNLAETHGFTFTRFQRIPRPRQLQPPPPPVPARGRSLEGTAPASLPYGQGTMDVHQTQRSQPSTVSSINSRSLRAANAATLLDFDSSNLYQQEQHNALCTKCHGVILNPVDEVPEASLSPSKGEHENAWNYNYPLYHPALQRNNSIGGFTLTGQDSQVSKKSCLSRVCSSHKIALVVSTFSFLVTIGLTITLILMKSKGMMEPM